MRVQWGDTLLTAGLSGIYSLGISSGGCTSGTDSVEVVVDPTPDADIRIQGESTFCEGESVTLKCNYGSGLVYSW